MIKIDDKTISSVYYGAKSIKKIIKGTLLVYKGWKKLIASGVPPITLQKCKGVDDGKYLLDYKIYGNSIQDGTPTPDTPVEIESVGEYDEEIGKYKIPVKVSGVNLHNHKAFSYYKTKANGITFTPLGDGTFSVKGTKTNASVSTSYRVVKAKAIPIKAGIYRSKPHSNNTLSVMFGIYKEDGTFWKNINSTSSSAVELTEDAYIGYCQISIRTGTTFNDIVCPQLSPGNVVYPYQEYVEPILTNIYLNEPIRGIEDAFDTIYYKDKMLIRQYAKHIFTGKETITLRSSQPSDGTAFMVNDINARYGNSTKVLCSRFGVDSNYEQAMIPETCRLVNTSTNSRFHFCLPGVGKSVDEAKMLLKSWYDEGNPMVIIYFAEQPIIEENVELPTIPTYKGTTIIEVDTNIPPNNVEVQYYGKGV